MIRTFLISLFFLIPAAAPAVIEARNRVEELFIWKISDEMKLSVSEEKNFADLVRELNRKRSESNEKIQKIIQKMAVAKNSKDREKLLKEHRGALKSYGDLNLEEADRIQKLFGMDRSATYFVLKNDLTNRLKTMLAAPEKPAKAPLPPPQVIEEN